MATTVVSLISCNETGFVSSADGGEPKLMPTYTTIPSPTYAPIPASMDAQLPPSKAPEIAIPLTVACSDPSKVEVIEHVLDFGQRDKGSNCPWGVGDNLVKTNSSLTARVDKSIDIEVDPERQICQFKFESLTKNITYDDAIFLLVEEYEVISTWAGFSKHFDVVDGIRIWDWNKIRGKSYEASGNSALCLGENPVSCVAPRTENSGVFDIELSINDTINIVKKLLGHNVWNFRLVVTGDNNEDLDCSYSPIAFKLDLVVLKQ